MSHFPNTVAALYGIILRRFPSINPLKMDIDRFDRSLIINSEIHQHLMCRYLFWMLEEVERQNDKEKERGWLGWIQAHLEIMGLMTNKESRDQIRSDLPRR